MSKRTRIGTKIDSARLAQLVSSPGIDPRVWASNCIVESVHIDADHGVFADVHIMSTATVDDDGNVVAQKETVRVAAAYAGNGFGLYMRPSVDDEVIVIWPDGAPDNGGILIGRVWSASDQPPSKAGDDPEDVLLMVESGKNIRIVVQGGGKIVLEGEVQLGSEDAALKNARVSDPLAVGTVTAQAGPFPVVFTYIPTMNVQGTDTPGIPSAGPSISLAGIISNSGGADSVNS